MKHTNMYTTFCHWYLRHPANCLPTTNSTRLSHLTNQTSTWSPSYMCSWIYSNLQVVCLSTVVRQLAIGQYQLDITNYMAFPPDLAPPSTLLFANLQLFASCSSQQNTTPTRPYMYQLEGFPICLGPTNQTISLHPTSLLGWSSQQ